MSDRITHLDTVRGVAVMGILIMNSISFGLGNVAVFDISAEGTRTALDWALAIFGEVFADQKFMGLFSLLFGASLLLFLERVEERTAHPVRLSLWRNLLLFFIGVLHSLLWVGDILCVYALCAPVLLMVRNARANTLIAAGIIVFSFAIVVPLLFSGELNDADLRAIWGGDETHPQVGVFLLEVLFDVFARALGMMLIGMGLYRSGCLTRSIERSTLQRCLYAIGLGALLSATGVVWVSVQEFDAQAVLVGNLPNTLATLPMTLGYLGVLVWWDGRAEGVMVRRIRAVGRMALTNYLGQTVLCMYLAYLIPDLWITRTTIGITIVAIWALQLLFSDAWLRHFRMGPVEWLWRCATYRRWTPLVR